MTHRFAFLLHAVIILSAFPITAQQATGFSNFENPQVPPIDLRPYGCWLSVCNTADALLEFFDTTEDTATIRKYSLGDPRSILWSADGERVYISGMESNNVIAIGQRLVAAPTEISSGPIGQVADYKRPRYFMLNRFEVSRFAVGLRKRREPHRVRFSDTTPTDVNDWRHQFYERPHRHSNHAGHHWQGPLTLAR